METEARLKGPDERLFDWVREGAEEALIEHGGIAPHILVEMAGELRSLVPLDARQLGSEAYKDAFCAAFQQAAQDFGVERYAFVCEGWVANYQQDPEVNRRPSEREDRREVLIVMVCNRESEVLGSMREILRDAEGAISGLGPEGHDSSHQIGGRFIGLLDAAT